MKKKKQLVVYALTASLLLSGCSLSREAKYEEIVEEPIIGIVQTETINQDTVLKTEIKAPSTIEEKNEIIEYIKSLEGDNQIIIYEGTSSRTEKMKETKTDTLDGQKQDQMYSEDIFIFALKQNPYIQFYYVGNKESETEEKTLALLYPNVTYVSINETVEEQMNRFYKANKVCSYYILNLREHNENFDLEEATKSLQKQISNIDKEAIVEGLIEFKQYVQNTMLFQKIEQVSDNVLNRLKPHIEKISPLFEEIWEDAKPYVNSGINKVEEIYEEAKPSIEEGKEIIKSLFGNKD